MSEIEILTQFKNTLISFLDELIEQFPKEGDLIVFRFLLKDKIPIIDVMNYFVLKIIPLKKLIISRNEDFFLNHCSLFNAIDGKNKNKEEKNSHLKKVIHFKKLWRSSCLDEEDRRIVWEWFESFVFLSEKYQNYKIKNQQIEY